mgnify:CR=1 FL=1
MFQSEVQKRLKLLIVGQDQLVEISDQLFHLKEAGQGEADLKVTFSNECVLFRKLEKKGLQYFQNQKCADYVLFEYRDDVWYVHIFELKRTISSKRWNEEIKIQFAGALQNALALAGVLGVNIALDQVTLYTVYRNDKINDATNPGKLRYRMHKELNGIEHTNESDWNDSEIVVRLTKNLNLKHVKVGLNLEYGTGEYCIG